MTSVSHLATLVLSIDWSVTPSFARMEVTSEYSNRCWPYLELFTSRIQRSIRTLENLGSFIYATNHWLGARGNVVG
jgi:hypothetical protein